MGPQFLLLLAMMAWLALMTASVTIWEETDVDALTQLRTKAEVLCKERGGVAKVSINYLMLNTATCNNNDIIKVSN